MSISRLVPAVVTSLLAVALTPSAAVAQEIYGKQTYPESRRIADEIAAKQTGTAWEAVVDGETADLAVFLSEERLLIGVIQIDGSGSPKHGRLSLWDVQRGERLWRSDRRNLRTGGYSLLASEPRLLLHGRGDDRSYYTAYDPDSGRRSWEVEARAGASHMVDRARSRLVVLDPRERDPRVRAFDLERGDEAWSVSIPEAVGSSDALWMVAQPDGWLVMADGALRIDADGAAASAVVPVGPTPLHGAVVPVGGRGALVWSDRELGLLDEAGRERWSVDLGDAGEAIAGVAPLGDVVVVTVAAEERSALRVIDAADGSERWRHDGDGVLTSPLAMEDGLLLFSTPDALVGLALADGSQRFRTPLPDEVIEASPTESEVVGVPDALRTEPGRLLLARESAGLLSFDLESGELGWFQADLDGGYYTGDGRYAFVYEALLMQAVQSGADLESAPPPTRLGIGAPGGSALVANAQRGYDAARARYDALDVGSAGRAGAGGQLRLAAEQQLIATELDVSMGRMSAGVEFAGAIASLGQAIAAWRRAQGLQALVDRSRMGMESVVDLQTRLFRDRWYVRPFYIGGRGRGVSIVDIDSGLRRDILYSPHSMPLVGYGLDLPNFALSPSGERIAMVGVSLDTDRWERRDKWGTHVPNVSLLTYDLADFEASEDPVLPLTVLEAIVAGDYTALRGLLDEGDDPNGIEPETGLRPLHMAVSFKRPDLVRLLIERGADPRLEDASGYPPVQLTVPGELRDLLMAAGSPAYANPVIEQDPGLAFYNDPFFLAVTMNQADKVGEMLAAGADPNMPLGESAETILHYAVALDAADIVRLLVEAGADVEARNEAGKTPVDMARSDAVKDALRGR